MNLEITEKERRILEALCSLHRLNFLILPKDETNPVIVIENKLKMIDPKHSKGKNMNYTQQFKDVMKKYWPVYALIILTLCSMRNLYA